MERVRKLVSAPDGVEDGQAKVTVAVLDTGERVMVLHRCSWTVTACETVQTAPAAKSKSRLYAVL